MSLVRQAHRLVVHPLVKVALQDQKLAQVLVAPSWPVVRSKQHVGICTEQLNALVDVLRPVQHIAHEGTTDGHEVVHRVGAVFRHAQGLQVREVEVHLRWRFGFGCQLENDAHTVNDEFLTGAGDVFGGCKKSRRAHRHRVAETAVDVAARSWGQHRPELIRRSSRHCRPGYHVLTDGFAHEVLGGDDPTATGIDFGAVGHPKHPAEVVGMRVRVDDGSDWSLLDVLVNQCERSAGRVLTRQRVDDDPARFTANESDVRDVVAAHLPYAVDNLEQPVVRIEYGMTPKIWVHGLGCRGTVAQELVCTDVEHPPSLGARDNRFTQRRDVSAANTFEIGWVWAAPSSGLVHRNGVNGRPLCCTARVAAL